MTKEEFTKDAEGWGRALNEASWEFHRVYLLEMQEQMPVHLFSNCKTILRSAIMKYAEELE